MEIQIEEHSKEMPKKIVGTQIPQEVYNELKFEADQNFMSISDLLRKLIYLHLRETEDKKDD